MLNKYLKTGLFLAILVYGVIVFGENTAIFTLKALPYGKVPSNRPLTDGKMHIYFCGTGNPQINTQNIRKPACLAVITDHQFLIFDAGEGAIQTLAGMGLPVSQIHNVFITHWHSDHFSGLGSLINETWSVGGRTEPMVVYGPYGVNEVISGITQAYRLDVLFRSIAGGGALQPELGFVSPKEIAMQALNKPVFTSEHLKITPFEVDHLPVFPAFGYHLDWKGCKIVISGDTSVSTNLTKNAQNADVLINEAESRPLYQAFAEKLKKMVPSQDQGVSQMEAIASYHSDTLALAKMAQKASVKKLILTHLLPVIITTKAAKQAFVAGMNQYYFGPMIVADDRDELVIESDGNICRTTYKPEQEINVQ